MSELLGRRDECDALDRVLAEARAGRGQVLVLSGEAGIGKTALLDGLVTRADGCRVARVNGVESERELAYAGLHQLCAPLLGLLDRLPEPQRHALETAFGRITGEPPDRFLVGLAVLTLLAEVAEAEPLVCVIDDAQWLDRVSAQTLAFVARRLLAERIALVVAVRGDAADFTGLPELVIRGLGEAQARALLETVTIGPVDVRVRDRIIAETRGNPLALLELPRAWTTAERGDGLDPSDGLAGRIEQAFAQQVAPLPADTRKLLLTAAAEPLGDATLLWAAAGRLGLGADPAAAAEATGLIEFGRRVRFRHPLVRSAVYRSAKPVERQEVHRVLAEVTDPAVDPDRRAWHRAQATVTPDEDVAADLEQASGRALARGGIMAAVAFLEQAAAVTPDPGRRAERQLIAARSRRDIGAFDAALGLLAEVEACPPDPLRSAQIEHLRGQIAFDQRRGRDAARLLLSAARRLEPIDPALARETHLEALSAAMWSVGSGGPDLVEAGEAALTAPPPGDPPTALDLVLDGLATRFTRGYVAAAPLFVRATEALGRLDVGADEIGQVLWLAGNRAGGIIATDMWDHETTIALAEQQVRLARDTGALVQLQFALNFLGLNEARAGNLGLAEELVAEENTIADVSGNPPVRYAAMLLAGLRGRETEAAELIAAVVDEAAKGGQTRGAVFADLVNAVLYNGLGRHDLALAAARRIFEQDAIGYQALVAGDLAEAASRGDDPALLAAAVERSAARAAALGTDWVLGIDARIRALAAHGTAADDAYRESLAHLGRTRLRLDVARGHLLYGEWLRREGHRVDAREHLRLAHESLAEMGVAAFADRARRELLATGETVRKRTVESPEELTAQELQIARLAREGFSNPEIGTRLFLSPRTVEWHMRKVFTKLGISSRRQLRDAVSV